MTVNVVLLIPKYLEKKRFYFYVQSGFMPYTADSFCGLETKITILTLERVDLLYVYQVPYLKTLKWRKVAI